MCMSYWKERGPKFHKKMLIIFHQQEINFKFISPGGLQPKTLDHFQGTQNTVLWKSPNMEGQRNVFVFWLERQSSLSASGFTAIASSLGSTVVSEGSMSKRQGRLTGSYRGESDGDGRFGHRLCREDPLEKELAAHSSILAWKIPWTMEPGRLPSVGSQSVGHDWATSLSLYEYAAHRALYHLHTPSFSPLAREWDTHSFLLSWDWDRVKNEGNENQKQASVDGSNGS